MIELSVVKSLLCYVKCLLSISLYGSFSLKIAGLIYESVNYKPQAHARICDENDEENKEKMTAHKFCVSFSTQKGKVFQVIPEANRNRAGLN